MKYLLIYTIQVILVTGLLYTYYHFFLRNRQFHQYNRFYLLLACIAGFILPLIRIPFSLTTAVPGTSHTAVRLLQTIYTAEAEDTVQLVSPVNTHAGINWWWIVLIGYGIVSLWLLVEMLNGLWKIKLLARLYPAERIGGIRLVDTDAPGTPFSFFNILFWDQHIPLDSVKGKQIFRHELFHIRQKHSLDVLFLQVLTIFCWINPFLYLIRKELRVVHEFLADEYASREEGEHAYAELLVLHVLKMRHQLVNPFFQTQIKRRIAMITNPKTNRGRYARKLLALPFAAMLLAIFAFRIHPVQQINRETITVMIDAGHGGFDPGVKSPDKKFNEAAMNLQLAATIQRLADSYGISVVLTRDGEEAIGATKKEDLQHRVDRSKEVKPAAFLSIHTSSAGKPGSYQETRSGFEAYITGKREDPASKELASALLQKLAGVYEASTTIRQRKHEGIFILDRNSCPAVLLECGYINNQKDLEFFSDESNREKVARAVLEVLAANLK
jgi:N-acetylmuramoyl-L-alanine amidase